MRTFVSSTHLWRGAARWAPMVAALALALVIAAWPMAPAPVSALGGATPASSPQTGQTALLDLAGMVLAPADLTQPGFVLDTDGMVTLSEEAARVNQDRGGHAADFQRLSGELRAAGWQRRYENRLGLPRSDDPAHFTRAVITSVTAYADATGAAAGFATLQDMSAIPTAHDVPSTRTIGDRSQLTSDSGTTSDNVPYQSLALAFQTGNLTAGVTIEDFTNNPPDVALAESLAAKLQTRIGDVRRRGDGLGSEILRLATTGPSSTLDGYIRRDGVTIPFANETAASFAARDAGYDGATDVYDVQQRLPAGTAPGSSPPYYVVWLYRFPNPTAAATWFQTLPPALAAKPGQYVDLSPVAGARAFGDESVTLGYGYRASETITTRGFMVLTRVGRDVARIQLDARSPVPPTAVETVAAAQVACLHAGVCPSTAPVPAALIPSTATPPATPAP